MKKLYSLILTFIIFQGTMTGQQQNYCDFEGNNVINFGMYTGTIDSMFVNPYPNLLINNSAHCAKYVRDTLMYDFIKMNTDMKLSDISAYADSMMGAPKFTMKVYSTAPVGTMLHLQLGTKSVESYPAGIHSEYLVLTTTQNAWEVVSFNYWKTNPSSSATASTIDKIVLLFNPGAITKDTMYFDDLKGPALVSPAAIEEVDNSSKFTLTQNQPNPAKQTTSINFQLNNEGSITLELYDMLGNLISTLVDQKMKSGSHSIPVETALIPNGIYFYTLKKDGVSQTKRMIISNK